MAKTSIILLLCMIASTLPTSFGFEEEKETGAEEKQLIQAPRNLEAFTEVELEKVREVKEGNRLETESSQSPPEEGHPKSDYFTNPNPPPFRVPDTLDDEFFNNWTKLNEETLAKNRDMPEESLKIKVGKGNTVEFISHEKKSNQHQNHDQHQNHQNHDQHQNHPVENQHQHDGTLKGSETRQGSDKPANGQNGTEVKKDKEESENEVIDDTQMLKLLSTPIAYNGSLEFGESCVDLAQIDHILRNPIYSDIQDKMRVLNEFACRIDKNLQCWTNRTTSASTCGCMRAIGPKKIYIEELGACFIPVGFEESDHICGETHMYPSGHVEGNHLKIPCVPHAECISSSLTYNGADGELITIQDQSYCQCLEGYDADTKTGLCVKIVKDVFGSAPNILPQMTFLLALIETLFVINV